MVFSFFIYTPLLVGFMHAEQNVLAFPALFVASQSLSGRGFGWCLVGRRPLSRWDRQPMSLLDVFIAQSQSGLDGLRVGAGVCQVPILNLLLCFGV